LVYKCPSSHDHLSPRSESQRCITWLDYMASLRFRKWSADISVRHRAQSCERSADISVRHRAQSCERSADISVRHRAQSCERSADISVRHRAQSCERSADISVRHRAQSCERVSEQADKNVRAPIGSLLDLRSVFIALLRLPLLLLLCRAII